MRHVKRTRFFSPLIIIVVLKKISQVGNGTTKHWSIQLLERWTRFRFFRHAMFRADLEEHVLAVVGQSPIVAKNWTSSLAFLFIDGGHGVEPAQLDYELWTPHVAVGGTLAIHDVFPDPADGGRPPYEQIYLPAINSGRFEDVSATGSLRVLRRV